MVNDQEKKDRTRPPGRPPVATELRRKKKIKFSCTEMEYEFLKGHSKISGHRCVALFLHEAIFSCVASGKFRYAQQSPVNAKWIGELQKTNSILQELLDSVRESKQFSREARGALVKYLINLECKLHDAVRVGSEFNKEVAAHLDQAQTAGAPAVAEDSVISVVSLATLNSHDAQAVPERGL